MLPTEDLFVYVYVVVDDAIAAGAIAIPARPGPVPGCSDGELLAIALVRHLPGRRSEAGFLAEVARDWGRLFPVLPHQSEFNRRIRWLWGAFERCGRCWRPGCPKMTASRWTPPRCRSSTPPGSAAATAGPAGRAAARFGRDAAHGEWFYGFRLAIKTDLGSRIVRAWGIVPAAVNERDVAEDLLDAGPPPRDLLADKGFRGAAFAAGQAARGTAVLIRPPRASARPCRRSCGRSSPSGATGSRPPSVRSLT